MLFDRRNTSLALTLPLLLAVACAGSGGANNGKDGDDRSGSSSGAATSVGGTGSPTGGQGGSSAASAGTATIAGQGGSVASAGTGTVGTAGVGTAGVGAVGGASGVAGTGTGGAALAGSAGMATGATGGSAGIGGAGAAAGAAGSSGSTGDGSLGNGMMTGTGTSSEQYATEEVSRNGTPYILITNGWGPGFVSHTVSWNGTSFIVEAMEGSRGSNGQPASYPSVFCGHYSVTQVPDCGLPRALDQITSLKTGWRWSANGNTNPYNAAYDIWLGTDTGFGMYLMVWLRDPPTEQPAGSKTANTGVTVANVPGVWDIWSGTVNGRPIINWVRQEGMDSSEIEFDVMDFIRDAPTRGLTITGTQVNAVAVGFEIWQGPVTNLETKDFYVDVK